MSVTDPAFPRHQAGSTGPRARHAAGPSEGSEPTAPNRRVATLALALTSRQPVAITVNTTGLIYLGTIGPRFDFEELIGAYVAAGVIFLALSLHDVSRRLLIWLPLPIVMGAAGDGLA